MASSSAFAQLTGKAPAFSFVPKPKLQATYGVYTGPKTVVSSAGFGGGLPASKSVVGQAASVLQQQAVAKHAELARQAEIRERQRDLDVKAAALGQEQAAIVGKERQLESLRAKISEAARKPLTTDVYYNKLVSEYASQAKDLQARASGFNESVGKYNALAKGLSEQYQVQQAKELKEYSPKVELKRTPQGTLYTKYAMPKPQPFKKTLPAKPLSTQGIDVKRTTLPEEAGYVRKFGTSPTGEPTTYLSRERIEAVQRGEVAKIATLGSAMVLPIGGAVAYGAGGLAGLAGFGLQMGVGYGASEVVAKESPGILRKTFPGKSEQTYQTASEALSVAGFVTGAGATGTALKALPKMSFSFSKTLKPEVIKQGALTTGDQKVFTLHPSPSGVWEYKPSPKPGIFDIYGKPIASTKPSLPVKWQPSPKPGVFDIYGKPIAPTFTFTKPLTAAEALAWTKGIPKKSPKPGLFSFEGLKLDAGVPFYKTPVSAAQALSWAKSVPKKSPKPGIYSFEGKLIASDWSVPAMKRPVTAKEALAFAKTVKKVKPKIQRPWIAEPKELEIPLGRTVTIQKFEAKTVSAKDVAPIMSLQTTTSQNIAGSYAQLSKNLQKSLKPTAALKARTPFAKMPFAEYAAMPSMFVKSGLTPIEKTMQKQVGLELAGRQRFASGLKFSPFAAYSISTKPSASLRQKRQAGIATALKQPISPAQRFIETPKAVETQRLAQASAMSIIPRAGQAFGLNFATGFGFAEATAFAEKPLETQWPTIPLSDIPRRQRPTGETFGYKVLVRGKGVKTKAGWKPGAWEPLSQNVYSKSQAFAKAGSFIDEQSLKRSFKIVPAKGKLASFTGTWRPERFRKTKAGTFVERTQFSLGQKEVALIQKARASAPKKRKKGGRFSWRI